MFERNAGGLRAGERDALIVEALTCDVTASMPRTIADAETGVGRSL